MSSLLGLLLLLFKIEAICANIISNVGVEE